MRFSFLRILSATGLFQTSYAKYSSGTRSDEPLSLDEAYLDVTANKMGLPRQPAWPAPFASKFAKS